MLAPLWCIPAQPLEHAEASCVAYRFSYADLGYIKCILSHQQPLKPVEGPTLATVPADASEDAFPSIRGEQWDAGSSLQGKPSRQMTDTSPLHRTLDPIEQANALSRQG